VATVERAATRLSVRVVRGSNPRAGRLRVVLPASASRPDAESRGYRTLCAVTQTILNATLEAAHPNLSELADRLRAAGVREAYIRGS
jgi:sirohydrochlorin ferrochelatase